MPSDLRNSIMVDLIFSLFDVTSAWKVTFAMPLCLQPIPKNISDVKKGEVKKVQVTEQLKGVKSLWG